MFSAPTSYGVVAYSGLAFVVVFFWEHVARVNSWQVRPSQGLQWTIQMSEKTWELTGRAFAHLGGIFETLYTFLRKHLRGLADTLQVFWDLHRQFIEAPIRFAIGFRDVLITYTNQTVVFFASLAVLAGAGAALFLYRYTLLDQATQFAHTYISNPDDLTVFQNVILAYMALRLLAALLSFIAFVFDWITGAISGSSAPVTKPRTRVSARVSRPPRRAAKSSNEEEEEDEEEDEDADDKAIN